MDQCTKVEHDFKEAQSELENIKTAVAVSESNKEEEIAKIRGQCEQEIATMQALLKGELNEAVRQSSQGTQILLVL